MASNWTTLKSEMKMQSKEELIGLIHSVYKLSDDNKYFLKSRFQKEDQSELLEKCRKKIVHQFFPTRGLGKCNLLDIKSTISKYKKLSNDDLGHLELLLTYVEQGTKFVRSYGDIQENAYDSMARSFDQFVKIIVRKERIDLYRPFDRRVKKLLKWVDDIGYGFCDEISESIDQLLAWYDPFHTKTS